MFRTLGLSIVAVLSKGVLPVKLIASKIFMLVEYCGSNYVIDGGITCLPAAYNNSLQYDTWPR